MLAFLPATSPDDVPRIGASGHTRVLQRLGRARAEQARQPALSVHVRATQPWWGLLQITLSKTLIKGAVLAARAACRLGTGTGA